jgi:hypothetical protein
MEQRRGNLAALMAFGQVDYMLKDASLPRAIIEEALKHPCS